MKKTGFTRIIAIVLALVLMASPLLAGIGSAAEYTADCPHIDLRGFMNAKIYSAKNDSSSDQLWPPTTDAILDAVKKLLVPLAKVNISHDWDAFADELIPALNGMLGELALDNNGEVVNGSGPEMIYPEASEVKKDGCYDFVYDWRVNPFDSAAQLNDFINYIADASGCGQVVLECHSYAGIVTLCYFSTYGTEKVKSVCFNSTAVYGANFCGDVIKGKLSIGGDTGLTGIGADSLLAYLVSMFQNNEYVDLIDTVADMLDKHGLLDFVVNFANEMLNETSDRLYAESIIPVLGSWPATWAMVPDDDLAQGRAYVFDNVLAGSGVDYSNLIAKIDNYGEKIRVNREAELKKVNDGTNLYVVSHYGYSSIPLNSSWQTMTDGVLNTQATSFGATCTKYNVFDALVTSNEYISPTGQIDASSCLFPEQTWFFRTISHVQHFEDECGMTKALLYYDGQATVNTFAEYPRFMCYDAETGEVYADDGKVVTKTWFEKFIGIFKELFNLVKSLFKK